jgi:hypothetical protein
MEPDHRLVRTGSLLLRVSVLAAPLVCLAGLFLMTAGIDECWILLDVRGLAEHGRYGQGSQIHSSNSLSTGGLYTVAATILHLAGGGRLEVIRLLGPLSLAGMLFLLLRIADRTAGRREDTRWMVAGGLLAAHGTFLLGSQAYGEILATVLVFLGALTWVDLPQGSWRRRVLVGLLLGSAAAARLNCLPAFVALGATLITGGRGNRRAEFRDTLFAGVAGALAFMVQWGLLVRFSQDGLAPSEVRKDFGLGGLLSAPLAYVIPERLGFFSVGQDHLALFAAVGVTAGWIWARRRAAEPAAGDVLLAFAWLLWAAWVTRAPLAHLRYLWPGLAAFAAVGGLTLAAAFRAAGEADQKALQRGVLAVALACAVTGYLEGSRMVLHGDSDVLSWEWHRGSPHSLEFGPFKRLQAQKATVRRLGELPASDAVATLAVDTPLAYLTRRPIVPVQGYYSDQYCEYYVRRAPPALEGRRPRWLVATPMWYRHPAGFPTVALHEWIEKNCRLEAQYGAYAIYEVRGSLPPGPELFDLNWDHPGLPLTAPPKGP